jgi:hypothetical protein
VVPTLGGPRAPGAQWWLHICEEATMAITLHQPGISEPRNRGTDLAEEVAIGVILSSGVILVATIIALMMLV